MVIFVIVMDGIKLVYKDYNKHNNIKNINNNKIFNESIINIMNGISSINYYI
jgi:hypothetical protein